jgi:hypothetical protein
VAFRVLTARRLSIRQIRAGAVAAAVTWQALQWVGALLLGREIKGATATYGLFALVLGTLAWIYVGAVTTVLCAEFNAVRAGQLWPRSLLTPFTDNVDLTPADRRAYTSYAKTERHKSFENIEVSFGQRPYPGSAEPRSQAKPRSQTASDPLHDVWPRADAPSGIQGDATASSGPESVWPLSFAGSLTQLADQQLRDLPGPDEAAPLRGAGKVSADDADDVPIRLGREFLAAPDRPIADTRLTQSLPVVALDDGDLLAPRVRRGFLLDRVVERSRSGPGDAAQASLRALDGRVLDADGLAQLSRGDQRADVGLARPSCGCR